MPTMDYDRFSPFNNREGLWLASDPEPEDLSPGQSSMKRYGITGTHQSATQSLRLTYFTATRDETVAKIEISTGTPAAATATLRMGIYNSTEDDLPDALQLQSASIDASTVGVKEATIDFTFNTGLYWLAFVNQVAAISVRAIGTSVHIPPVASNSFLVDGSATFGGSSYYKTGITGALPASWGGTDTAGAGAPKLMVRAK